MKHLKAIIALAALQLVLDVLYIYLYPSVSPLRATLIGFTALLLLYILPFKRLFQTHPLVGFLSIYSSAFFGALLVQANVLESKSFLSAAAHIAILVLTYGLITALGRNLLGKE
ncbi:MAG: hypothetical protein AAB846_00815 [Patescibacteria group bacterium]